MPPSEQDPPPFDLVQLPGPDHSSKAARASLSQCRLPPTLGNHKEAAKYYRPTPALLTAINMAIHVGAPLLLTGEPGTGKTQVADFIGDYFDIQVFKFQVKSTSTADDLKFDFDAVGYLHWAQSDTSATEVDTLAARRRFLRRRPLWQAYACTTESVLLIDEIDKAPRDFPNDLLHELDQHCFMHPVPRDEHDLVKPVCGRPPILVVTSNDERRLPDAFLRRCIFHRIELEPELIEAAVKAHVADFPRLDAETRAAAQKRFWELRERPLDKKPSTAELLVWLCILSARETQAAELIDRPLADLPAIGALVKDAQDLAILK